MAYPFPGNVTQPVVVPTYPKASLGIKVSVVAGNNQIQRNVGVYDSLYLTDTDVISDLMLPMAEEATFAHTKLTKNLVIKTNNPVTLSMTVGAVTIEVEVSKIAVFDFEIAAFTITSLSDDTRVYVNMRTI